VVFPRGPDGRRSTSALGRCVVADALRQVDGPGALAAEHETNWRAGYLTHFRRLVEAGLSSPEAALGIAGAGLGSLHRRMHVIDSAGEEAALNGLLSADADRRFHTVEVPGSGQRRGELALPYRGQRLRGDALLDRLDTWVTDGVVEPSCAEAVGKVVEHPEWLSLPDRTVAVLGAGSEMGPLTALLRWGARVAAVDLPDPAIWNRVLSIARRSAGSLLVPVSESAALPDDGTDHVLSARAGADLLSDVPSVAVDALTVRVLAERRDAALAFLATPTDVFAVPEGAVSQSAGAYENRSRTAKLLGRPLRTLSGGRLLRRAYVPGVDPGVSDSLVAQQGPNYALAKRLQRWRASVARHAGTTVSLNVAPPTRTRSVVRNRVLAAAYAGASRFGIEVFEPATSNVLMAALLVHDLHTDGGPPHPHPWQDEAHAAVHGGLWRAPYAPRSALGLAAVLGYGAARA
jgi:hypothetical protein